MNRYRGGDRGGRDRRRDDYDRDRRSYRDNDRDYDRDRRNDRYSRERSNQ